jgi:hypothetical protein
MKSKRPDPNAIGRGRGPGIGPSNCTDTLSRFPTPRHRARDGLIGLTPTLSPGELVEATAVQLEREAHLRGLAGTPDRYLSDLARWLRAGGRHDPNGWEATT